MRYQHSKALAVKCRHRLPPWMTGRLQYCTVCLLEEARDRLEAADTNFEWAGGPSIPPTSRSSYWCNARLSYRLAQQDMHRTLRMAEWRETREIEWRYQCAQGLDQRRLYVNRLSTWLMPQKEKAHDKADSERTDEGYGSSPDVVCPVCKPEAQEALSYGDCQDHQPAVDRSTSWWERPGMLVTEITAHPSPQLRTPRSIGKADAIQGSVAMRNIIRKNRADLAAIGEGHQEFQSRWKTEMALREKHRLSNDVSFPDHFWQKPISNIVTRKNHQQLRDSSRMSQRRARGNTPRSRPARSSLSFQESADNVYPEEDIQEEEHKEMMQRKARKVGATVGYLYFNGKPNMLDDWKDDFLRSNHTLVTRIWTKTEDTSSEVDMMQSVESEESPHSNDNGGNISDEELMDAFLEPDVISDDDEDDPMEVDEQHRGTGVGKFGRSGIAMTVEFDHSPNGAEESLDVMNIEYTNGP